MNKNHKMKSLKDYVLNENLNNTKNITKKNKNNGLVVMLNLSELEEETIGILFNDSSIDWSVLDRDDLFDLYDALNVESMEFEEWLEANNNFK